MTPDQQKDEEKIYQHWGEWLSIQDMFTSCILYLYKYVGRKETAQDFPRILEGGEHGML